MSVFLSVMSFQVFKGWLTVLMLGCEVGVREGPEPSLRDEEIRNVNIEVTKLI